MSDQKVNTKRPPTEGEKDEYIDTLEEIKRLYQNTVEAAKNSFDSKCKEYCARLAAILQKREEPDGTKLPAEKIRKTIVKDIGGFWTKQWIEKNLPQELLPKTTIQVTTGGQQQAAQAGGAEEKEEDPKDTKIRELKDELKLAKETSTNLQKLQEKNNKRMSQMTESLAELQEFKKSVGEKTKLADRFEKTYNPKLDAIEVVITSASIARILEFAKTNPALGNKYKLVLKVKPDGNATIDSIKKV